MPPKYTPPDPQNLRVHDLRWPRDSASVMKWTTWRWEVILDHHRITWVSRGHHRVTWVGPGHNRVLTRGRRKATVIKRSWDDRRGVGGTEHSDSVGSGALKWKEGPRAKGCRVSRCWKPERSNSSQSLLEEPALPTHFLSCEIINMCSFKAPSLW